MLGGRGTGISSPTGSPGYEVFAEADAQGLTDSTPHTAAALQNKQPFSECGTSWIVEGVVLL